MLSKPTSLLLVDCVCYYLALCRAKGLSHNTVTGKSANLSLFLAWCQLNGINNITDVNNDLLVSYQAYMNEYKKPHNGQHLCRATIRSRLTAVTVFLRCMLQNHVITSNEFESFELPKLGRRLPKPILSQKEILQIFEQVCIKTNKGLRDRAILETFYATGMRRSELSKLTLNDIDFHQKQVRINQGKGFKDRYVPIAKRACYWLYRYLKYVRPEMMNELSENCLFISNSGKPFRPTQLSELVSKYIKLAGITKKGACNQYRHAAATHMVDNGADIRHVQEFLGHADISTTQIYLHVSMAKLRAVYEKTHPAATMKD